MSGLACEDASDERRLRKVEVPATDPIPLQLSADLRAQLHSASREVAAFFLLFKVIPDVIFVGHAVAVQKDEYLARSLSYRLVQDLALAEARMLLPDMFHRHIR